MRADNSLEAVRHILKYCYQIDEHIERFGNDKNVFLEDSAYNHACSFAIFQIGELTVRLSDEFKEENNEIPWHKIRGIRNIIAHQYGTIDMEIMWEIITDSIPDLKRFCEAKIDC